MRTLHYLNFNAMPKYIPNLLFSDCYASVGNVTFFHIDGECYVKTKPRPLFPGTAGQQIQLSIHQRGLQEWRNLVHDEQLEWNALAKSVRSKRLPYNATNHISGYNLFISAYHGLACIGEERLPEPKPVPHFPIIYFKLASAEIVNEADLQIVFLNTGDRVGDQFRIIGKIQLTTPGYKAHRGKFRNHLGNRLDSDQVSFIIHNYRSASNLDLREYQVHLKYFLIDSCSVHRSEERILTACISI